MADNIEKIVIIGSGPAGHTASMYMSRAMLSPLMYEGFMAVGTAAGGQLTTTTDVENFPGFPKGIQGPDLMEKMREHSLEFGARIKTETISKVNFSQQPFVLTTEDGDEIKAHSVLIATGASAKRVGLPSEEQFWQKGISTCAVCDGALPLFRDKQIVVVGGGDSACEEAEYLTKYASKVFLFVRKDHMRASKILIDRVSKHPKIEVCYNVTPVDVKGDNTLNAIIYKDNNSGEEKELTIAGLFYAIGHRPNVAFLEGQVELTEAGYIKNKSDTMATSVEGVFSAGDVRDEHYKQAIIAAGSGAQAALEVESYLIAKGLI